MSHRSAWLLVSVALVGCARMSSPGFPPPARAAFLVPTDFETTFQSLATIVESRGMPVIVADSSFGSIQTDWMDWDAGELDLAGLAQCDQTEGAPPARTRARFAFDVRPRANRATVTIRVQWQTQRYTGFNGEDGGFVDCRSTGEWERRLEEGLTQRGTIR